MTRYRASPGERAFDVTNHALLAVFALACLFPVLFLVVVSFATNAELDRGMILPTRFTLDAYRVAFGTANVVSGFQVSVFVTSAGVALSLFLTSLMAYGLSRRNLPGRRVLTMLVVVTMMVNAGLIPFFLVVKTFGLVNTVWSLIVPTAVSGFNVILMRNFFAAIPEELEDAARLDGCGEFGVLFRIVLPLSKPALAAFGLFTGVAYWNAYFNAVMFINDPRLHPLQVVLRQLLVVENPTGEAIDAIVGQRPYPQTLKAAVVVISIIPVLLVYPWLQKHFARGVLMGSIKG